MHQHYLQPKVPVSDLIKQEVIWCREHRGMKPKEFEDGFLSGLNQALYLIKEFESAIVIEDYRKDTT